MMRDARSWSQERRCRKRERAVSAANLHPADSGTAPRATPRANWHLACAAVAWLAESCIGRRRRPLCWNVRESAPCMSGPQDARGSSSSPAALFPAAFHKRVPFLRQDPRRASYIRYHSPCFQGRVPIFFFGSGRWCHLGSWQRERKKRNGSIVLHIRPRLTEVARQHSDTGCAHLSVSLCLATIPSPDSWKFILIAQAAQPTCDSVGAAAAACTWRKPPSRYNSGSSIWAAHTRCLQCVGQ